MLLVAVAALVLAGLVLLVDSFVPSRPGFILSFAGYTNGTTATRMPIMAGGTFLPNQKDFQRWRDTNGPEACFHFTNTGHAVWLYPIVEMESHSPPGTVERVPLANGVGWGGIQLQPGQATNLAVPYLLDAKPWRLKLLCHYDPKDASALGRVKAFVRVVFRFVFTRRPFAVPMRREEVASDWIAAPPAPTNSVAK